MSLLQGNQMNDWFSVARGQLEVPEQTGKNYLILPRDHSVPACCTSLFIPLVLATTTPCVRLVKLSSQSPHSYTSTIPIAHSVTVVLVYLFLQNYKAKSELGHCHQHRFIHPLYRELTLLMHVVVVSLCCQRHYYGTSIRMRSHLMAVVVAQLNPRLVSFL